MFQKIKNVISEFLYKCNLDLKRASSVPFGAYWHRDIKFFPNGRILETVLDVGANTGQTALKVARLFPKSRIYSFEPVPSTFQELVRNTARISKIEPVCCALGADCGLAKMTATPLSEVNTLMISNESNSKSNPIVQVKVDTVDSFCSEREIQLVNLLKIDTEGFELNVLRGAQHLLAEKRIDFILVECDFSGGKADPHGAFADILSYLSPFDFHVVSFYTGGVDDLGWYWGDVLFRRRISGFRLKGIAMTPASRKVLVDEQNLNRSKI